MCVSLLLSLHHDLPVHVLYLLTLPALSFGFITLIHKVYGGDICKICDNATMPNNVGPTWGMH